MVIRHDGLLRRIWGAPQPIGKKRKEVFVGVVLFVAQHVDLNLCVLLPPVGGFQQPPAGVAPSKR